MRVALVAMIALAATKCTTPSQPGSGGVLPSVQVQAGAQFELSPGQEARIQGSTVTVRFQTVSEDSRCPLDVQCVWAGNAVVRLTLSSSEASSADVALNTTLAPSATTYGGYTIRLVGLKPTPKAGARIPLAQYVAILEAAK